MRPNLHIDLNISWLSNNDLDGEIPTSLGSPFQMSQLILCNNRFIGELPSDVINNFKIFKKNASVDWS